MSVHAEYGRSLETLIDRMRGLAPAETEAWIHALEVARVSECADLSEAARRALEALASIEAEPRLRGAAGLEAPRESLKAHCRAILGESPAA